MGMEILQSCTGRLLSAASPCYEAFRHGEAQLGCGRNRMGQSSRMPFQRVELEVELVVALLSATEGEALPIFS